MINRNLSMRTRYANDKRQKRLMGSTKRVAWKTPSRFIA